MQYLSAIALCSLAWQGTFADDSGALEWSQARRLSWDDFTGSVPAGTDGNRVAETSASLAWSFEYSLERSPDYCVFSIIDIRSAALFHPENSWVRAGHRTAEVLVHEQGHFDITELYRERFAAQTREYLGSKRNCRGRSDRAATRSAESEIAHLIGSVYDEIWRQYRREQESYDTETRHGIDSNTQAEWSEAIAASLNSAKLR